MQNYIPIESELLIYQTDSGQINVDVILNDETIWMTQKSMAKLFEKSVSTINYHLSKIFDDEELEKKFNCN